MATRAPRLTAGVGKHTDKGTLVTQATRDAANADYAGVLQIREDNTERVQNAIFQATARALEKIGLTAEAYAKKDCPVDTGRLRNSITHVTLPAKHAVYIGTNVEYAAAVELGTSHPKRKAHPYLRPAAKDHMDKYRAILKSELERG